MVGWHHRLDGHEFGQAPGVGDGQGSLASCSPWHHKESDMTEGLNWSGLVFVLIAASYWSFCIGSYIRMSWGNGHILRVLRYFKQGFVNYGPWVRFDPLLVFKQTTIRTVFTFLNHWLGSTVWQRPYVVCKAYNSYCLAFYKTSILPTNPLF